MTSTFARWLLVGIAVLLVVEFVRTRSSVQKEIVLADAPIVIGGADVTGVVPPVPLDVSGEGGARMTRIRLQHDMAFDVSFEKAPSVHHDVRVLTRWRLYETAGA